MQHDDSPHAEASPRPVPTPPAPRPATDAAPVRVTAALAVLEELDSTALAGHPDVYDRIHGELRAALAEIDRA